MKKIGIVGCGTIGTEVAKNLATRFSSRGKLTAIADTDKAKANDLLQNLGVSCPIIDKNELIDAVDLIVEAASPQAVKELLPLALEKDKEIMIVSTGGLIGFPDIFAVLAKHAGKIHIPSGAIVGLDGIRVAAQAKLEKITLTTTKPPRGLKGVAYLQEQGIDLDKIDSDTVVFDGTVKEAVSAFPKNINVCATLALTAKNPDLVKVRIIASPTIARNVHQIEIEGNFGKITCMTENVPSPTNPKTSYLAVLSVIETLDRIL